jgi:GH25 family lysozyme M1 (1,4-beta-N-acetylmuramidase)
MSGELLPVLDLEEDDFKLTDAQMVDWVKAFLGRVYERTGLRALIYVSPNFWENQLGDSRWFADNGYSVLWIAHWEPAAGVPAVPAANWGGEGWTFWQYDGGSVPGIQGNVDLDVYRFDDFTPVLIP